MLKLVYSIPFRDWENDLKLIENGQIGILFLFIKHTSAALTLNENADIDVRKDMDAVLDEIVPESFNWRHVDEGEHFNSGRSGDENHRLALRESLRCNGES
jgi:thiamine phosphate synthase YjbQ (UPF0047 family)